jgi:exodeoxyribonuclease-5
MADRHSGQHHDRAMAPESAVIDRQTETFIARSWASRPRATKPPARRKRRAGPRTHPALVSRPPAPANSSCCPARRHAVEIGLDRLSSICRSPTSRPGPLLPAGLTTAAAGIGNTQTRASFAAEAEAIAAAQTRLTWLAPSRDENAAGTVLREEEAALWMGRPTTSLPNWKPPSCRVAANAG